MSGIYNLSNRSFIILAPLGQKVPTQLSRVFVDNRVHQELLEGLQRFRGQIYTAEGALDASHLTPDGRHLSPADYSSWHLLALDKHDHMAGCIRYIHYPGTVPFESLALSQSGLAQSEAWGPQLRKAVAGYMAQARKAKANLGEAGGWAIRPEHRCTTIAFRMVIALYVLARLLGDAVAFSTATHRNNSSSILRRMGGLPLEVKGDEIPPYYDPQFKCKMEIIRFDINHPVGNFRGAFENLANHFCHIPVILSGKPAAPAAAQA